MISKSIRAIEIDELVGFIRTCDIPSARQSLVKIMERGDRISKEIVSEFQQLERAVPPLEIYR